MVGRPSGDYLVQLLLKVHSEELSRTKFRWLLKISKEGDPATCLENLFQTFVIYTTLKRFLIFTASPLCFNLCALPPVLSDLCSTWCPPGHPGPFLLSCFWTGWLPACPVIWCFSFLGAVPQTSCGTSCNSCQPITPDSQSQSGWMCDSLVSQPFPLLLCHLWIHWENSSSHHKYS